MKKFVHDLKIGSRAEQQACENGCEPVWVMGLNLIKARTAVVLPLCNL